MCLWVYKQFKCRNKDDQTSSRYGCNNWATKDQGPYPEFFRACNGPDNYSKECENNTRYVWKQPDDASAYFYCRTCKRAGFRDAKMT